MSPDTHALRSQIEHAFGRVTRPSKWPESGYVGHVRGPKGQVEELPDEHVIAARAFSGVNWRDVDAERYRELSGNYKEQFLSFHSHAAFAYYVPAYMLMMLNDGVARLHLLSALAHALSPVNDASRSGLQQWQQERFSVFTADQAAAIAAFLAVVEEQWGVELGMVIADTGWNSFTAARRFWEQRASEMKDGLP
jgi:hypothetical protein